MTAPKIPEAIKSYLQEIDLTIWACQHPLIYDYAVGGKPGRGKADKSRVQVQLAGPGLDDFSPWGEGPTVGDAVRAALANVRFRALRGGLDGAFARLEEQMVILTCEMAVKNGGFSDDIPF